MQNNYIFHLKPDNTENSRPELKGIVLPVPSNQIKVTFIIILPLNLIHQFVIFFLLHIEIERKCGWIRVGGGKGYVAPLSNYWGGGRGGERPPTKNQR